MSLRSILDGFRLVVREPALLGIFTVDTVAMIFGMPSALFPAFGEALGGGASTVGLLYAAPSAGALVASVFSGWMTRVRGKGSASASRPRGGGWRSGRSGSRRAFRSRS